jgi:hypothetical protein
MNTAYDIGAIFPLSIFEELYASPQLKTKWKNSD